MSPSKHHGTPVRKFVGGLFGPVLGSLLAALSSSAVAIVPTGDVILVAEGADAAGDKLSWITPAGAKVELGSIGFPLHAMTYNPDDGMLYGTTGQKVAINSLRSISPTP